MKEKIILGIETSCDDTGIAVLGVKKNKEEISFNTLANEVSSQIAMHREYGGVFPAMAKREHARNIVPLFIHALEEAKLLKKKKKPSLLSEKQKKELEKDLAREPEILQDLYYFLEIYESPKIDVVTVTVGPGLEPTLWVGINFAKVISKILKVPIIPTNHMEGHILSILIPEKKKFVFKKSDLKFPMISLLVSGGHTELVLVKNIGKYKIIGQTRDDAAGEAFDKIARMLGLDYPGGPEISRLAQMAKNQGLKDKFNLPKPMIHSKDLDFSFSGLKTSVLYKLKEIKNLSENDKKILAKETQDSIVEVLVSKTIKAVEKNKAKTLIVAGGVASNEELRNKMGYILKETNPNTKIYFPTKKLSTDNALMIAVAGYMTALRKKKFKASEFKANGNLILGK
jgi:N6-L-threonylcarbamoyladenine synthase